MERLILIIKGGKFVVAQWGQEGVCLELKGLKGLLLVLLYAGVKDKKLFQGRLNSFRNEDLGHHTR